MPIKPQKTEKRLFVTIRVAEGLVFQGQLRALTGINHKGTFDLLPDHINFISIISQKLTLHIDDAISKDVSFSQGLLKCADNKVKIYLGLDALSAVPEERARENF